MILQWHLEIISDFLNFIASLFKHYLKYQLFTKHFKDFTIKGDKAYCLKISRLIKDKLWNVMLKMRLKCNSIFSDKIECKLKLCNSNS